VDGGGAAVVVLLSPVRVVGKHKWTDRFGRVDVPIKGTTENVAFL